MKQSTQQGLSILGFIALIAIGAGLAYVLIYLVKEPTKQPTVKKVLPTASSTPVLELTASTTLNTSTD